MTESTHIQNWFLNQNRLTRWRGIGLGFQVVSGLQLSLISWVLLEVVTLSSGLPWWMNLMALFFAAIAVLNLIVPLLVLMNGNCLSLAYALAMLTLICWLAFNLLSGSRSIMLVFPAGMAMLAHVMHRRQIAAIIKSHSSQDDWAQRAY